MFLFLRIIMPIRCFAKHDIVRTEYAGIDYILNQLNKAAQASCLQVAGMKRISDRQDSPHAMHGPCSESQHVLR